MSLFRHTVWASGSALLLAGSRFVLAAILARRLSQAGFGAFAYAQWLVDISFLVCSLGATGAASRYAAEFRGRPGELAEFLRRWRPWAFFLPVLAGLAVLLGAWLSGIRQEMTTGAALFAWTVASGWWAMQTAALTGLQRFDRVLVANALVAGTTLVGAWLLPLADARPTTLYLLMAGACLAGSTVGALITGKVARGAAEAITTERWRTIQTYAANIWLTALLWSLVWSRGEFPIVRHFLGVEGVASYAAAMVLLGGATQAAMLAVSGIGPHLTRLWGEDRQARAIQAADEIMQIQLLVCGAGALVLIWLGTDLMAWIFGPAYAGRSAVLGILGMGLLGNALAGQNHLLQIATDARFSRNTTFLGLMVLMGLAWLLTPLLGLEGTAMARAGAVGVLGAVSILAMRRRWGRDALRTRSILAAVGIAGLGLACILGNAGLPLPVRIGGLAASMLLLAVAVRNARGESEAFKLASAGWYAIVRPGRSPDPEQEQK